jgi:hypothetical protein
MHKRPQPRRYLHPRCRIGRNLDGPNGVFQGQSDIGAAVVPGSVTCDANTKQYTINSIAIAKPIAS